MNGTKEQNVGDNQSPSLLNTFNHALNVTFFKEKSFVLIFLDHRLTFNLLTIFFIMFMIPVRNPVTGLVVYDVGHIVEGMMMSMIFIGYLFLFVIHRKINFMGFFRVFLAIECVDIFSLLTLAMNGELLRVVVAIILGWYLSLSIVTVSRLGQYSYFRASLIVLSAFFFVNIIPVLFQ